MVGFVLGSLACLILFLIKVNSMGFWKSLWLALFIYCMWGTLMHAVHFSPPQKINHRIDIVALQDNITPQGKMYLGSGELNGELTYFYYRKEGSGFIAESLGMDDAIIQYTTDQPHIEWQTCKVSFGTTMFDPVEEFDCHESVGDKKIIYIPEGSIVQNYTLDLK